MRIDGAHLFRELGKLFWGQRGDGHIGHGGFCLGVCLLGQVTLVRLGIVEGCGKDLLVFFAKALVHSGVHQHDKWGIDVVGLGDEFLNFLELHVVEQVDRALLRIKSALLQRSEELAKSQWRGVGANRFPSGDVHFVLHSAHLHAFQIIGALDHFLAVRQLAKAVFPVTHSLNADFAQAVE